MCEPMTLAAVGATLAGTAYNQKLQADAMSANRSAQEAAAAQRNAYRLQEQERQDQLTREREAILARSIAASGNNPRTLEVAQARREEPAVAATNAVAENPVLMPTSAASAPTVVDNARELSKALSDARKEIAARSFLAATNDVNNELTRLYSLGGSQIDTINSKARGSLGAYDVERNRAFPVYGRSDSPIGDLLIAGGSLGTAYAGAQAGAAAGAARTAGAAPAAARPVSPMTWGFS